MKWIVGGIAVVALTSCSSRETDSTIGYSTAGEGSPTTSDLTDLTLKEVSDLEIQGSSGLVTLNNKKRENESFLLAVSASNTIPASYSIQLSDSSANSRLSLAEPMELETEAEPAESEFHQYLREMETVLAESEDPLSSRRSTLAALTKPLQVGETQKFKALSSLSSISRYKEIDATLQLKTDNVQLFVEEAYADHVDQTRLEEAGKFFDEIVIPRERELFGNESDVNGDGMLTVLMTCNLNGMSGSGGIVTGFFFPGDLYAVSKTNPASNEQEIFYVLMPDPKGECGAPISADFVFKNILTGVLAHEYQHMISYNQHVLIGKGSTEEPWLNEALSHLAEDLTGFGQENPSRVKLFLDRPNRTALIPSTSPGLAERGAGYLFLRYLYEQSSNPSAFMGKLLEGSETGVRNLTDAFGAGDPEFDDFQKFINRWSVAVALSNSGVTKDSRFNYRAQTIDPDTGNRSGICLRCDAQDGRGTILKGPTLTQVDQFPITSDLSATATQFFLIYDAPEALAVASSGGPKLTGTALRLER